MEPTSTIEANTTFLTYGPIIISIISAVIALIAIGVSVKSAQQIMRAEMREKWIIELRTLLANILTDSHSMFLLITHNNITQEDFLTKSMTLKLNVSQASLMLDVNERDHNQLDSAIHSLSGAAVEGDEVNYVKAARLVESNARTILKKGWKEVKTLKAS